MATQRAAPLDICRAQFTERHSPKTGRIKRNPSTQIAALPSAPAKLTTHLVKQILLAVINFHLPFLNDKLIIRLSFA